MPAEALSQQRAQVAYRVFRAEIELHEGRFADVRPLAGATAQVEDRRTRQAGLGEEDLAGGGAPRVVKSARAAAEFPRLRRERGHPLDFDALEVL